jgi:Ca-activated chloride channel family protein
MDTAKLTNRLCAGFAGICLAVIVVSCSSVAPDEEKDSPGLFGDPSQTRQTEPAPYHRDSLGEPEEPSQVDSSIESGNLEELLSRRAPNRESVNQAPAAGLEELLERVRQGTTADSAEHEERLRQFRAQQGRQQAALANARAFSAFADATALTRIQPGEEVWIIAQPAADDVAVNTDGPGSGAMLASLVWPDDVPPQQRHTRDVPLPLEHTDVQARVTGYIGTVDVTQQFTNPYNQKIEAVYMFPLPEKAAVNEFVMTIGERRIRGILREKEQAAQIYRDARAQGYQASLLIQHRPNIFEQKVANIEPGHQIDVSIRYFHTLKFEDGWYSFVFPTVVGPRYNPPGSTDPIDAVPRTTFAPQNTSVPYLAPNERSGHDISISVELAPGVAIEEVDSTHAISRTFNSEDVANIRLANRATIPNRDFVLNFRVAGEQIKSNLMTWVDPETNEGYFTMTMYPPSELHSLRRQPLELVFVLDCSGSMAGAPMAQSKDAILAALRELEPNDTFQIIRFSNNASQFGPEPVPATRDNIRRAEHYVRGLSGTGGTQMIEGIKAALDFPHDEQRLRFVTFLTDGYIGNEVEILGAIHERLGDSRIFSFGVGSSVNRYLLERMAGVGRGAVAYLGLEDSGTEVMDFFFDRIAHPAMIDVEIDWNGMNVADVYPSRLPDLFVGRSVVVTGRFIGDVEAPTVRGRAAGERIAIDLEHTSGADEHQFIAPTWARLKIADLEDRQTWMNDPSGELANEILATALSHNLMSEYTSFVAVDASRLTEGNFGTTVYQAVPVPQGVRYETSVTQ